MLPKFLIALAVVFGLGFGGYYLFNNYFASPDKVLFRASEQLTQLKTVHADMDISMAVHATDPKGTPVSQETKISGFSDANIQDKTQKLHMNISVGSNSLAMDMVLLKAGEMYMKIPAVTQDWIGLNTKVLKESGNLPIDPQSSDYVTQSLGFLKSVDKNSVIKLEDEVVDGIKTTHLRLDISTPKYIEYLKQLSDDKSMADSFKDATAKSDVWIDQKTNYVVKMESTVKNLTLLDKKTNSQVGSADMTLKITYSKFNQAVDISKPTGTILKYEDLIKASK